MTTHIIINGREVTNPVARWLFIILGISFAFAMSAFLIFIVLPLIGLTVTLSLGLALTIFLAMLVILPLLAAFSVWLGLLSIPYQMIKDMFRRR